MAEQESEKYRRAVLENGGGRSVTQTVAITTALGAERRVASQPLPARFQAAGPDATRAATEALLTVTGGRAEGFVENGAGAELRLK